MMKTVIIGLTLLFGLATARAAATSPADARAREYFDSGAKLSAQGRYAEALAEFSAGYELSRRPAFLINMGECARLMGDPARAREHFEHYLREAPQGQQAPLARQRLSELAPPPAAKPRPTPPVTPVKPATPVKPVLEPRRVVTSTPPPERLPLVVVPKEAPSRSVWKSPWLWTGIGAAVLAGSIVLYATTRNDDGCSGVCVTPR
jgi:tetratricopeptide (TPR) repeat protein